MGISPSLEIAKRALIAQRLGLDATSGNIANINTPGYSRRVPQFSEGEPIPRSNGFVGTGVLVSKLKTYREEFFDKQIRRSFSSLNYLETDSTIVRKIAAIFGEPSDTSLDSVVTQFFNSFEDLSQKPTDIGLRERTLSLARTMLTRFKEIANQLQETRNEIRTEIDSSVNEVNRLVQEIADLNHKIASSVSKIDGDKQTFIDQRATKLEELSKLIDVTVTNGEFDTVNVFVNGINLITGVDYLQLKSQDTINSLTGERTISLLKIDKSGRELSTVNPQSGKLASLIKHFNNTLDDKNSSSEYSIATNLENFFAELITKINDLTSQGYGLTDTSSPPPGRNLFVFSSTPSISSTELNPAIVADPRLLPISEFPGEVGDSGIARRISRLASDSTFFQDQTPIEYISNLIATIGSFGKDYDTLYTTSKTYNELLLNQRESIIGVNLEEEAINLLKFQKAFEATSRVVSTLNDMLSTLVNLGR